MSQETAKRISLFRSHLQNRRFDSGTLCVLESVLISKDVKSLLEVRSMLRQLLRSESLSVLREIPTKTTDQKLSIVQFFVNALALVGDVESCLALKYEALILRQLESVNHHRQPVSYEEWVTFAEDSFENGFYSIAAKGFENALVCIQPTNALNPKPTPEELEKMEKHRDTARSLVSSHSVHAHTMEYLNRKSNQKSNNRNSCLLSSSRFANLMFRNGIKKRHVRQLHKSRNLEKNVDSS